MSRPIYDAYVVADVDYPRVRRFITLLRAVVDAETQESAQGAMQQFLDAAERSAKNGEAAFAAAQALRDLDVIEPAEAAYVFYELYGLHAWEYEESDEKRRRRARKSGTSGEPEPPNILELSEAEMENVQAEWKRQTAELEAAFHNVRGESALAELILRGGDEHIGVCCEGEWSLVDGRPSADEAPSESWAPPVPMETAKIRERIMAMAATETHREAIEAWRALVAESEKVHATSAVTAAQELRGFGMISENEAAVLISLFTSRIVSREMEVDRECARITRRMEALEQPIVEKLGRNYTLNDFPPEWKELEQERERRAARINARCLRRFGEHALANLQLEAPDEYYRIAENGGVGVWAGV